jgi:hypothetical protein
MSKTWVYDYNPYVLRDIKPDIVLDMNEKISNSYKCYDTKYPTSMAWILSKMLDINLFLRHPRLYRFEDNIPNENLIAIHTTAKGNDPTRQGHIPENILTHLFQIYKDYKIFQVGGKDDFKIKSPNVFDKTGLNYWDTAEIISKCLAFIGMNSGHTILANCFPRVQKKVILSSGPYLQTMIPESQIAGSYGNWIDFNWQYYNNTENDIGVSMSYLKI